MLSLIARRALELALAATVMMTAAVAEGVTPVSFIKDAEQIGQVTTGAAVRARADVQIRRIKSLLVSKGAQDNDADFDKLEKLQKDLRGQN